MIGQKSCWDRIVFANGIKYERPAMAVCFLAGHLCGDFLCFFVKNVKKVT